jgi:hypothetical protein
MRPVLCQKAWLYCNVCINNNYFDNKLSAFVFQNISLVIHYNTLLNEGPLLYLKIVGRGASFLNMPEPQRVLEMIMMLNNTRCA